MPSLPVSKSVRKKLEDIAKKFGGGKVLVGFVDGWKYADGTPVASVAFWNEFGTSTIPSRPFFRTMIANDSKNWTRIMAGYAKHFEYDGKKTLTAMGDYLVGALQDSIINGSFDPLSETTLALRAKFGNNRDAITYSDVLAARRAVAKGTAKLATGTQAAPLRWTGDMLRHINFEVKGTR